MKIRIQIEFTKGRDGEIFDELEKLPKDDRNYWIRRMLDRGLMASPLRSNITKQDVSKQEEPSASKNTGSQESSTTSLRQASRKKTNEGGNREGKNEGQTEYGSLEDQLESLNF